MKNSQFIKSLTSGAFTIMYPLASVSGTALLKGLRRRFVDKIDEQNDEPLSDLDLMDEDGASIESRHAEAFKKVWYGVNAESDLFLAGISLVKDVAVKKNGTMLSIVGQHGDYVWANDFGKGKDTEFIGVATTKRDPKPISDDNADELAALAAARGWTSIRVHGSTADKDKLWFAAKAAGLKVEGYKPTPAAVARYKAYMDGGAALSMAEPVGMPEDFGQAPRLVDHGAAPFENKPDNAASYFATFENESGAQHTVWGVDLERAITDGGVAIGDRVDLEHTGAKPVTLPDGTSAVRNSWHLHKVPEPKAKPQTVNAPKL